MTCWLSPFDRIPKEPARAARLFGGKAAHLAWLHANGFKVPTTVCLQAERFSRILASLPSEFLPRNILSLADQSEALHRAARARDLLQSAPLDPQLREELQAFLRNHAPNAPWGFAVRSSATCEDDEVTSMAGLASSVLGLSDPDDIIAAIRQVWASALLPRAISHLSSRGIRDIAMGVVLQVVVPADASGVMLTRPPDGVEPAVWAPDERLINATRGLACPLVDGEAAPDIFKISASDGSVRSQTIQEKLKMLVGGPGRPDFVDVPANEQNAPSLGPEILRQLAEVASRLEGLVPRAFDVEFAVERGQLVLVQARPIVGTGFPEGGDVHTIWSRANLGEALPGVATPLTWSIAQSVSENGFRRAFASLGCTVPKDASLVANVHGRFYLNLTAFMTIASQVPGLRPSTLVRMAGGAEMQGLEEQRAEVSRAGFWVRLPKTIALLAVEHATLARQVESFVAVAEERRDRLAARNLSSMGNEALGELLVEVREWLDDTGPLMLSCASGSLASYLLLRRLLEWMRPGEGDRLVRELTPGGQELESAKPGIVISRIAAVIKKDERLSACIMAGEIANLDDVPKGAAHAALGDFFDKFGDRAVREAELSTPRWRENQKAVFGMLAAALGDCAQDPELIRERADGRAERCLAQLASGKRISPQISLVRVLVSHSRRMTALRESMRSWVTKALGSIRKVALEIDCRLLIQDPALAQGSVFFCTFEDCVRVMQSTDPQLSQLLSMRKADYLRDSSRPEPPVSFVGRPTYLHVPPAGGETMRGLAASGGVVEGRVRVISSPPREGETIEAGEILVARTTDVGLTPLFLVAAGVVTELGGPLSHAAIVAREYGVPAVVNVSGVTLAFRTGDRVRVDGNRGIVERLGARVGRDDGF